MASFQANIGWKSMTKRENNCYRSVPFPTRNRKFQRIAKKCQKIIVKPIWRHFQIGRAHV